MRLADKDGVQRIGHYGYQQESIARYRQARRRADGKHRHKYAGKGDEYTRGLRFGRLFLQQQR